MSTFKKTAMKTKNSFNIYECFDQDGQPVKYICDGHLDSEAFREKCYRDFFIKPKVVQHLWRRSRRFLERNPDRKFVRAYTGSTACSEWDSGATPETVGVL